MADLVVTFHCARGDAEALMAVLREAAEAPVHARDEQVLGRDFGDAGTGEQVEGLLRRIALEVVVAADRLDPLVAAVAAARRRAPVRWQAVPLHAHGRIA